MMNDEKHHTQLGSPDEISYGDFIIHQSTTDGAGVFASSSTIGAGEISGDDWIITGKGPDESANS